MDYTKLPDNVLRLILKEMLNRQDDGNCDFDYEPFDVDCYDELNSICGYFGVELKDYTDRSYFIQLWNDNPDFETKPIVRPSLATYEVIHEETERVYRTNYYSNIIQSYYPVDNDMLYSLNNTDEFYYYEGSNFDTDVHDSEITDDAIQSIRKIEK
jgi:hypothetical protein